MQGLDMLTVTGLAVIAVALSTILKQKNPEFSLMISLLTGILILGMIISAGIPLFERIEALLQKTGARAEYVQILFKALGICFITQIACDACRDLGETAVASKVEAAGKISVLLISLPLFEQILAVVGSLIG
ncbi:SpoIIIAC/SpoIIIAD family protein [Anaerotruncus rubiinfantis]|jgi:stage III sporulation protein AD|uniref:SpoIIIAC/SpoIIIAD family protein n=2 Tax=Oscillospiraceae TaxID=216572 RepID=UPI001FA9EDF7|nr:SpoIIIAC/SpoIIIAD family protein [Anaerotruncus rubiinfantis]